MENPTDFRNADTAGDFLASRIVDEAQRTGVPMSDVERAMLYFSEPLRPGVAEINKTFDREYNSKEYEQKVARLIGNAREHARTQGESKAWAAAVRKVTEGDNHLSVMINLAGASVRPRGDRLKLWGTGLAICLTLVAGMFLFQSHC